MIPTRVAPEREAMLASLFDYAGLFPPAKLSIDDAVAEYLRLLASDHAWMVGPMVLPATRLKEFATALEKQSSSKETVSLSVLSPDWTESRTAIEDFRSRYSKLASIDAVETKQIDAASEIAAVIDRVYIELPFDKTLESNLRRLRSTKNVFAKMRTGGLTAEAFPSVAQVASFIWQCNQHDVAFKATAGLHHPLPASRSTCDQNDAPIARMHGFVNVISAAGAASQGATLEQVADIVQKSDLPTVVEAAVIREARQNLFHSIGSCSIAEPVNDLKELGWL